MLNKTTDAQTAEGQYLSPGSSYITQPVVAYLVDLEMISMWIIAGFALPVIRTLTETGSLSSGGPNVQEGHANEN